MSWPATTALGLEEAFALGATADWRPVLAAPVLANNQLSVTLPRDGSTRYFRLHTPELTSISTTSPVDGETGVAVTRETIVSFSGSLATNAIVPTANFYATAVGRRLLSRVELSSDRTKASLFYLEPLPGSARVNVVFDGAGLTDALGRPLDPAGTGSPNSLKMISFDTLSLTPLAGTAVIGTVYASELVPGSDTGTNAVNQPLAGVTISVDGMEQTLRTITDATGNFKLSPVPPGRFFVHIDGRTVVNQSAGIHYPDQAYYPFVGKAWEAVAGRQDNLAGGTGKIYLPLITAGTLQPVSMTADTTISFPPSVVANNPALAGVSITVPANSLFSDDGTRGGKVGMAPVPPDRLPGPLPPGADLPLVITVQTDGPLNFDKPAPACFPNLPNSTTGKPWPPGTKGSLLSFNHKKGVWEDVGGMTVSADGRFFCTDPGVGIIQPGWHGPQCPKPQGPPPPPPPPVPPCKPDPIALQKCFDACKASSDVCRVIAALIVIQSRKTCEDFRSTRGNKYANGCLKTAAKIYKDRLDQCALEEAGCDKGCVECSGTPRPKAVQPQTAHPRASTLGVGDGSDAIKDQILEVLNSIDGLLAPPYLDSDTDLPPDVVTQVEALFAHANAIAGGDSEQFLENYELELERANVALRESNLVPNRGNAPGYPVLYAAEVQRGDQTIVFRGKTEPFGQYLVFVPPDGELVSVSCYDPRTKQYDHISPNLRPEASYALPAFVLHPLDDTTQDSDHDGLPDVVEFVYGTDPNNPDSNGDGIPDGAEVDMGLDPLGGFIAQTGVIATAKTPGRAVDVGVGNDLVVTAEGAAGISIFNAYTGDNPIIIAHVPTPGNAQRVAVTGDFVAVAQPDFGLSIIDVSTPAAARIVQQFPWVGAQAVVADGSTAYIGAGGVVVALDLATGLGNPFYVTNTVRDLALNGHYLYALMDDRLLAISVANGTFALAGSVPSPFFAKPNQRLFVGGGIAYAVHTGGYNTFDLGDPSNPTLIKAGVTTLYGWKQLVSNGSGLGLAAVGPNSAFDFAQDISLYDLSSPTNTNVALTIFPTPGEAQSVAIWNGLAYVADADAGLQVINYLPYDNKGVPPRMTLLPDFDTNGVPAGTPVSINADATDDVQVRNVEFYLDGAKVISDGNFPFAYRFVTPALTTAKTNFTLRARAFDTGGNAVWSDVITTRLLPDTTPSKPPTVNFTTPIAGGARTLSTLRAFFSKPIDPVTLTSASFHLFAAGADGTIGTADDVPVTNGVVSYTSFGYAAALTFAAPLPVSRYRAVITTAVVDLAGNHLATDHAWDFQVADATFWINFGDGPWDVASNWDTDVVPTSADNVIINFPVTVTLRNNITLGKTVSGVAGSKLYVPYSTIATFDGLTLNVDLLLDPNVAARVTNGLTLNGVLTMPGGYNYTQLNFDGTQTFDGTGQVVLADLNYKTTQVEPISGTLTIGPNLTIRGSGVVGNPSLALVNLGTMVADTSAPGSSLTVTGSSVDNRGTLSSRNGGLLITQNLQNHGVIDLPGGSVNLTGAVKGTDLGTITGSGSTISILGTLDNRNSTLTLGTNSGSWQLAGGTILGGVVTTTGGAQLIVSYFSGTLDGVRVEGDIHVVAGATLRVLNGLTLDGTATLDTGGNYTQLTFDGTQTFDGTGQVVLTQGGEFTLVRPLNGALTIGPKITIRGSGVVGWADQPLINHGTILAENGRTMQIYGTGVTNTGTLDANNATISAEHLENQGTLSSSAGGTIVLNKTWNNAGTIGVTNATLNLDGAFTLANLGTINSSNATVNIIGTFDNRNGTLTLDQAGWRLTTGTILGGTIQGATGIALAVQTSFPTLDGVILNIDLTLYADVSVRVTNGLTLNRTAALNGGYNFTTLNFDGTQTLDGIGQLVFVGPPNSLVQPRNGTLTIGSGLTIRGGSGTVGNATSPLVNQGTITADGAGSTIHILGNPFTNSGTTNELNGGKIVLGP